MKSSFLRQEKRIFYHVLFLLSIENIRTYAQSVNNLLVSCVFSIYCGYLCLHLVEKFVLKLWIMWINLLID
ncbi:hypothetical protein D0S48_15760 [Psychrobacillus sp. AK 1817]|nr:hypothetical protein D0S48_15760 [Psychrobacillus sp. AK 1817]